MRSVVLPPCIVARLSTPPPLGLWVRRRFLNAEHRGPEHRQQEDDQGQEDEPETRQRRSPMSAQAASVCRAVGFDPRRRWVSNELSTQKVVMGVKSPSVLE